MHMGKTRAPNISFVQCYPISYWVHVPRQESERSCIWVLGVSTLPLSTILTFDFGIVQTVWYFLVFYILFLYLQEIKNKIACNKSSSEMLIYNTNNVNIFM